MAYKDSKKLSTDADNSAPSTVAFHRTVRASINVYNVAAKTVLKTSSPSRKVGRTCRDLKQPESQHMRTKVNHAKCTYCL